MNPLAGIDAKLDRAKAQIAELTACVEEFFGTRFIKGHVLLIDRQTTSQVAPVLELDELPVSVSVILGDIVHNLRGALDHLAWQIVASTGRNPSRSTYFPICKTADCRNFDQLAKQIGPEHQDLLLALEAMQPRTQLSSLPEEHELAILNELSNCDKHRALIVRAHKLQGLMVTDGTLPTGPRLQFTVGDEVAVEGDRARVRLVPPAELPTPVDFELEYIACVSLGGGRHRAVITLANDLFQCVSRVVHEIRRFVGS
jgi:hypothetical protein